MRWTLLVPLLLAGCGSGFWGDLTTSVRAGVFGLNGLDTEETEVEGRFLRVGLGSRTAQAALVQESGARRLWRTPAGAVIATEGARVVATGGLPRMVAATRLDGPDPLADPKALVEREASARRLVDLMDERREPGGMRFGVALRCRLRADPVPEEADTLLVEERCRAPGLGEHVNRFWAEAGSGAVIRSEQWIGPGMPTLVLEEVQ